MSWRREHPANCCGRGGMRFTLPPRHHTIGSATAAICGVPLLGMAGGRRIPRPLLSRHRGVCVVDCAIDRLHCLAVGADVQPADGIADIGGRWIAALCRRPIRRHRLEHHPGLNHRQNASRLVRSAGSQPRRAVSNCGGAGCGGATGRASVAGAAGDDEGCAVGGTDVGCVTRRGLGCTGGAVGLGAAGRDAAATICCSCAFCCAAAASSTCAAGAARRGLRATCRFGACRIEIMRALRDLLLQIGNLTPHCILRRLLFRDGGGGRTGAAAVPKRLRRSAAPASCEAGSARRCLAATCRFRHAPHRDHASVARPVAADRQPVAAVRPAPPAVPRWRRRTDRARSCRSGCGDLLLLRLAKLVQRVDVLPQLAGFGVRRIEIMRTLRDLLLQIGNLTPQCILRRLLFRDGWRRTDRARAAAPMRLRRSAPPASCEAGSARRCLAAAWRFRRVPYQDHASVARPVAADRHFDAAVHPAPPVVPHRRADGPGVVAGGRAGCGDLLFRRLAELLQRLDVLPKLSWISERAASRSCELCVQIM